MTSSTKIDLLAEQRVFVERCARGEFVDVMVDYYHDDVYQIEGDGSRRDTKKAIVQFEEEFLKNVQTFHGIDLKNVSVASDDGNGNGVTMAQYSISADMKDGSKFNPDQVQVSTWENGKIVALRYYYDPSF